MPNRRLVVLGLIVGMVLLVGHPGAAVGGADPTVTWNTFLGSGAASGGDYGASVAIDAAGFVYVAGKSSSTWGTPILAFGGSTDAFVAKLDSAGALVWHTFLGGTGSDAGVAVAVDGSGNVLVTGYSSASWDAPIRPFAASGGSYDAFVAKLDASGARVWNTFLNGAAYSAGTGIAVATSGAVYVTGESKVSWGAPVRPFEGDQDVFVARLDTDGTLVWNTFLGWSGTDYGDGIAVDADGNVAVIGFSQYGSWGLPIEPLAGNGGVFVARLDAAGALTWSTFLERYASGNDIAVDGNADIYVTGQSDVSWGTPVRPHSTSGGDDAFVAKLGADGALLWNTFLGGTSADYGEGIAIDAAGNVHVAGWTRGQSWGDPSLAYTGGASDAFVARLDGSGTLLANTFLGGASSDYGAGVAVDASGIVHVAGHSFATWGAPIRPFAGWFGNADAFVAKLGELANAPPVAADQSIATIEDTAVTITSAGTDGDGADGNSVSYAVVTPPEHGSVTAGSGQMKYVPEADYVGPDSFTFRASDGIADSNAASVAITITPVNDEPVFVKGANQIVAQDCGPQSVAGWATSISAGAADEAGQGLHFVVTNDYPELFSVPPVVAVDGTLTFTPAAGASGVAWFNVQLRDDGGIADGGQDTSALDWFVITVTPLRGPPPLTVLTWNTFAGAAGSDFGTAVAVDAAGNIFMSGFARDTVWPLASVTKVDPDGAVVWQTFFGDPEQTFSDSSASDIAVDPDGNVYVTGSVYSFFGSGYDGFAAKLDADGVLVWHTSLGGGGSYDRGAGIAVDADGNAYVSGISNESWGSPLRPFADVSYDAFAAKLGPDGALIWNTFLGGAAADGVGGIAVDAGGTVYLAGYSEGTWGAPTRPHAGGRNVFVAKLDTAGGLSWNTFLEGSSGHGIAVDADGSILVAGGSGGTWGVPRRPFSESILDVFVAKLDGSGALVWNTFLGGQDWDEGAEIAVDASGNLYTAGTSYFSWGDPIRPWQDKGDASVAKVNADGVLMWNTFLGSMGSDYGNGIAVDANGDVTVVGSSDGTWGAPLSASSGDWDPFVAHIRNPPPVADDAALDGPEDRPMAITLSAADPEGSAVTYTLVSAPAHGTLTGTAPHLTYEPDADFNGADSLAFKVNDSPADSNVATVSITVNPVNDAPSFAAGLDQTVLEDAAPQSIAGWATGISAGPADEAGQALAFVVTNDNNALFAVQPAVAPDGTLTFEPAADGSGSATMIVRLVDNGGTAYGGADTSAPQSFTITVTPVNDAPAFVKGPDQTVLEDAGTASVAGWATGIGAGSVDEGGQVLAFAVQADNVALFAVQPAVAPDGTLTFTPALDANGSATVTLSLEDGGGTAGGGADASAPQSFTITVVPVNDAPIFAAGPDQVVLEEAGPQSVAGWATGISAGPANETEQTLAFTAANDNNTLFSEQPAVAPDGTLTFTPAADASGSVTVTLTLVDSGGAAGGGHDASTPWTFTIRVGPYSRVLWTRDDTGQAVLWKADPGDAAGTPSIISILGLAHLYSAYGVGGGWEATSYVHVSGTEGYVLWARGDSGRAVLWKVDSGSAAGTPPVIPLGSLAHLYAVSGVGSGWRAASYDHVSATEGYVLWTRGDTGQAVLWKIDPSAAAGSPAVIPLGSLAHLYRPSGIGAPWQATSYDHVSATEAYVLWTRSDTGQACLWRIDPSAAAGSPAVIPVVSWAYLYSGSGVGGPWQATSYEHVAATEGYVLWTRGDTGQAALWRIDPSAASGKPAVIPIRSSAYLYARSGVGGPWRAAGYAHGQGMQP